MWMIAVRTLAPAAFASAAPPQHCPLAVLSGLRSQGTSYLVVTPAADTVRAAAARGGDRALHGQVVRLDRSIGEQRAAGMRAVLVPWGRDDSCRRVRWASSARWLRPGKPALVEAKLRPRARWVHGMPTYDVDAADRQPYPEKGEVGWEEPLLSVTEFADFLASAPTEEADSLDPEAARRPLWTWARRHRALAAKGPRQHHPDGALRRPDPPQAGCGAAVALGGNVPGARGTDGRARAGAVRPHLTAAVVGGAPCQRFAARELLRRIHARDVRLGRLRGDHRAGARGRKLETCVADADRRRTGFLRAGHGTVGRRVRSCAPGGGVRRGTGVPPVPRRHVGELCGAWVQGGHHARELRGTRGRRDHLRADTPTSPRDDASRLMGSRISAAVVE